MLVSLNRLKKYIDIIEILPEKLADSLTMCGLEVETFYNPYAHLEKIIVCEIKNIVKHPNADRLQVCEVDTGDKIVSVVCGAPNVYLNMRAAFALPGAKLKEDFVIKKTVIRGVKSVGMLCSEAELGLGDGKSGIIDLDKNLKIGTPLCEALNLSDYIFDISITPNRFDCLSIIGIAREIGAISGKKVKYPEIKFEDFIDKKSKETIEDITSVTIEDKELCQRYAAAVIIGVKPATSPLWLANALKAAGLTPINNIVDITNFVMLETGQPLHAFDFNLLFENRIVVKKVLKNQKVITLDNKKRILEDEMLMICDAQKPVAIAGIMGGLNSEIKDNTNKILLESAYFNPIPVRKASKKLGINSDSAYRFERGVDPDGTIFALKRAAALIAEIAGGKIVKGIIDKNFIPKQTNSIKITEAQVAKLLGVTVDKNSIKKLLESIEFKVEDTKDGLLVTPPSFRADITRSADIIEEIARLNGYDKIPVRIPVLPIRITPYRRNITLRNNIKAIMKGLGFSEVINYSFIDTNSCDKLQLHKNDYRRDQVVLLNPLSLQQTVMRSCLIPSLLETASLNIASQIKRLKIFETGKIFLINKNVDTPIEIEFTVGLWTGKRCAGMWHNKEEQADFYDIKGVVETLCQYLHIEKVDFIPFSAEESFFTKKGACAKIMAGNTEIGIVGEIADKTRLAYDIKQKLFVFEINCKLLTEIIPDTMTCGNISKFPAIVRDITVIVSKDINAADIYQYIISGKKQGGFIEKAEIFDIYEGEQIPSDKKSISFSITYQASDKTLTDEQIAPIQQKLVEKTLKKFNASLPA
ncbi:MAG: phenylalanine--tRNA ligase subunit beta [Deltaproteobacteria bacterium]|nr:phenylalanine--tRNA ligase subunit beta [Deltaproteobacteria bacterium]